MLARRLAPAAVVGVALAAGRFAVAEPRTLRPVRTATRPGVRPPDASSEVR